MNPREASLLHASAILLARHGIDASYGPAHAVRDALALETEVSQQTSAAISRGIIEPENFRVVGAV